MARRLSLRARLVLGVIVLTAVGLAAANIATYTSLRSFLMERTDDSLVELEQALSVPLRHGDCPGPAGGLSRARARATTSRCVTPRARASAGDR